MRSRSARIIALWSSCMLAALWIVVHADYITDLSAFLPARPTPIQRVLVEQLRDGPASRLILVALEAGDPKARAALSAAMARRLRQDREFSAVDNGESRSADNDREYLFQHRYLLSDAVTAQHFSAVGLRSAITETIDDLASPAGLMLKSLVPHDPTGEMLRIIDRLARTQAPRTQDGVWVSADGLRALLVAQTVAAGSDTDAQERAGAAIRAAFGAAVPATAAGGSVIRLRMSGPGVFAVAARAKIKRAATRLSIISGILVIGVLLAAYRSPAALGLGLLPVASGALLGIAAVALGFGAVHGITLGFGITLIGESVDYSIYFFIQSRGRDGEDGGAAGSGSGHWQQTLWPTIRLGLFTSVCGFASLLPSGFPGLAQLGLYSISGLLAAALVTRFLLPVLLPRGFAIHDVAPLGSTLARLRESVRRRSRAITGVTCAIVAGALLLLYTHHHTLWNRELASLSPVSLEDQRFDAVLRADLGAADVLDLIIVSGPSLDAVLQGAERAGTVLESLIDAQVIGDFDTPAVYLPSLATQQQRRGALPDGAVLADNLQRATAGLDLQGDRLAPFRSDVAAARRGKFITALDLHGTSLAAAFDALILHSSDHWSALLPLHAPAGGAGGLPRIDTARVAATLAAAHLQSTQLLDFKAQTDALYGSYLQEAMNLSLAGFVLIVLLLLALRSILRVVRVLLPLIVAVLVVAAGLISFGQQLTILHLVGMLLIVAIGSNYALFFDREGTRTHGAVAPLMLASLAIANLSTVIGFGLLSFSQVPVLEALGSTVAPGAFLALLFSALLSSGKPVVPAHE